jgi:hypothetical protein
VCRLISRILHNAQLTYVWLDHEPSACVVHDAWKSEGLPVPPGEVVGEGWRAVLQYLRKAIPADVKAAAKSKAAAEAQAAAEAKAAKDAKFRRARSVLEQLQLLSLYDGLVAEARDTLCFCCTPRRVA